MPLAPGALAENSWGLAPGRGMSCLCLVGFLQLPLLFALIPRWSHWVSELSGRTALPPFTFFPSEMPCAFSLAQESDLSKCPCTPTYAGPVGGRCRALLVSWSPPPWSPTPRRLTVDSIPLPPLGVPGIHTGEEALVSSHTVCDFLLGEGPVTSPGQDRGPQA